jgi:hypothetical protein
MRSARLRSRNVRDHHTASRGSAERIECRRCRSVWCRARRYSSIRGRRRPHHGAGHGNGRPVRRRGAHARSTLLSGNPGGADGRWPHAASSAVERRGQPPKGRGDRLAAEEHVLGNGKVSERRPDRRSDAEFLAWRIETVVVSPRRQPAAVRRQRPQMILVGTVGAVVADQGKHPPGRTCRLAPTAPGRVRSA